MSRRAAILVVAAAIALGACAGAAVEPAASPGTDAAPATTGPVATAPSTTTTTSPVAVTVTTVETSPGISTAVYAPEGATVAIVLVPGGGWRTADPDGFEPMARDLASRGLAVYLTTYDLDAALAFDEIACVVAIAHRDVGPVVLAGHSTGAQLTATVTLGGDRFTPIDGCIAPAAGYTAPEAWVGLSGPYEIRTIGAFGALPALERFIGGSLGERPGDWERADPYTYVDAAPGTDLTLVHGRSDIVAFPVLTQRFAEALVAAGGDPVTVYVDGADHDDVLDPSDAGAESIRLILEAADRVR